MTKTSSAAFIPTTALRQYVPASKTNAKQSAPCMQMSMKRTRRSMLQALATLTVSTVLSPTATQATMTTQQATETLLKIQSQLPSLHDQVNVGDLADMRRALRTGALSRLRASARQLATDCATPAACADTQRTVGKLIRALEAADAAALQASRGSGGAGIVNARLDEVESALRDLVAERRQ